MVQLPVLKSDEDSQYLRNQEAKILDMIDVSKDVDGLTAHNFGFLFRKNSEPSFYPCTALGVIELLKHYNIQIEGKHAVIVGRSSLSGLPLSGMLQKLDATVTLCHSQTQNLSNFTRSADILIIAVGKAHFITADMVKPDSVVIDVGINRNSDKKVVGDVDFELVSQKVRFITPVPGGVGPMTIAMLMSNLVKSWKKNEEHNRKIN